MRFSSRSSILTVALLGLIVSSATAQTAAGPVPARSAGGPEALRQATIRKPSDPVWEGILIGAAAGAAIGVGLAPRWYCGSQDTECAAIVRVAIGLPAIGVGALVGGIVDKLHEQKRLTWEDPRGRWTSRLDPVVGQGSASVRLTVDFK